MTKNRIGAALPIAGALLALACIQQPVHAQAPALPTPDSVSLDALGYMQTFPPAPDKQISNSNRFLYPQRCCEKNQ